MRDWKLILVLSGSLWASFLTVYATSLKEPREEEVIALWRTMHGFKIMPDLTPQRDEDVDILVIRRNGEIEARCPFPGPPRDDYGPVERGTLSKSELTRLLKKIRETGFFNTRNRLLSVIIEGENLYRLRVPYKGKNYDMVIDDYFYEIDKRPADFERWMSHHNSDRIKEVFEFLDRWNKLIAILGEATRKVCK